MVEKFRSYGADDNSSELIKGYLTNWSQRARLRDQFSNWKGISLRSPQGSILGPLIYNIFMNDLVHVIKHSSLSAYADNTRIIYADKASAKIEETINNDPARLDIWLEENGKRRSQVPRNRHGKGVNYASVSLWKHRNPHNRRFWDAWSNDRR